MLGADDSRASWAWVLCRRAVTVSSNRAAAAASANIKRGAQIGLFLMKRAV